MSRTVFLASGTWGEGKLTARRVTVPPFNYVTPSLSRYYAVDNIAYRYLFLPFYSLSLAGVI